MASNSILTKNFLMIIFKLPHQNQFYTIQNHSDCTNLSFHPFDGENSLNFQGEIVAISKEEILDTKFNLPIANHLQPIEEKEKYLEKIKNTIKIIQKESLSKLVVARKKRIQYNAIDLPNSFLVLCEKYPSAFVYAWVKNNTVWMGAFSEVLGTFNKKNQQFSTMSLAGTLPLNEVWTKKEIEEQKPVTDYISSVLKKYSSQVQQSETYDHISGKIKHLRTDFQIKTNLETVDTLLKDLHPTPAVCGIPKEDCKKWILELENFDREWYAGYSKIETSDIICAFVNLRCGQFYQNQAEIWVGGGITKDSNPEKDWRETDLKASSITECLVYR